MPTGFRIAPSWEDCYFHLINNLLPWGSAACGWLFCCEILLFLDLLGRIGGTLGMMIEGLEVFVLSH